MSTTIRTMPTVGERAIITEYEERIPATFVGQCDVSHAFWVTSSHWCFDEPIQSGATWTPRPDVAREPTTTRPEGNTNQ